MRSEDRRHVLKEEVFTYRAVKGNKVFITWSGKVVTTLSGEKAKKFLRRVEGATPHEAQLAMAKATGNFKRGNEKRRSTSP